MKNGSIQKILINGANVLSLSDNIFKWLKTLDQLAHCSFGGGAPCAMITSYPQRNYKMFAILVIGGFLVLALIANIIFPSDGEFENDKSYAERKSNSKFYKKD